MFGMGTGIAALLWPPGGQHVVPQDAQLAVPEKRNDNMVKPLGALVPVG